MFLAFVRAKEIRSPKQRPSLDPDTRKRNFSARQRPSRASGTNVQGPLSFTYDLRCEVSLGVCLAPHLFVASLCRLERRIEPFKVGRDVFAELARMLGAERETEGLPGVSDISR